MRNKISLTLASLIASLSVANAESPLADWSGAYAGAYGQSSTATVLDVYDIYKAWVVPFQFDAEGTSGGLLAGYNIQNGNLVYGIEADFFFGGVSGTGLCTGATTPSCSNTGAEPTLSIDQVLTLKARLGYSSGDLLFFGTVGVSSADVTVSDALQPNGDLHNSHSGYTVGAGMEWLMSESFSLGIEYEYGDYEAFDYALVLAKDAISFETSSIKATIRYQF